MGLAARGLCSKAWLAASWDCGRLWVIIAICYAAQLSQCLKSVAPALENLCWGFIGQLIWMKLNPKEAARGLQVESAIRWLLISSWYDFSHPVARDLGP